MKIEEKNGMIKITADDGYFLTNNNGLYGVSIWLGFSDAVKNYEEKPMSEYPVEPEPEEPSDPDSPNQNPEHLLALEKDVKLKSIDDYDTSFNVNGFLFNGMTLWLDRINRVVFANVISSAEVLGQETVTMAYNDEISITLPTENAKLLLASLELYAASCYNITLTHKNAIKNMSDINDVINFDITADYPPRLEFNI